MPPLPLSREYRRQFRAVRTSLSPADGGAHSDGFCIFGQRSSRPFMEVKPTTSHIQTGMIKANANQAIWHRKVREEVWHVWMLTLGFVCVFSVLRFLGEDLLGEDIFGRSLNPNAQTRLLSFIFPLCLPTQRHCTHIRSLCSSSVRSWLYHFSGTSALRSYLSHRNK